MGNLRVFLSLALLSCGCTAAEEASGPAQPTEQQRSPIYGVYEETTNDDASNLSSSSIAGTVVRFQRTSGKSTTYCSGVLIAPDLVLSAAHCDGAFGTVTVTNAGRTASSSVKEYELFPSAAPGQTERHDIALVRLTTPIPQTVVKNFAPVFLGDINDAIRLGRLKPEPALAVGYGHYCPGEDCGFGSRRKGWVDGAAPAGAWIDAGCDPTREACTSFGDSGGPLFMRDARGVYHVVGVLLGGGDD